VRVVVGFGRFWWDFIVGDDWRIAAGVVTSLAAGAVLVSATNASDTVVSIVVAAGVVAVVAASVVRAARRARPTPPADRGEAPVR
jgi:hypothetical protein